MTNSAHIFGTVAQTAGAPAASGVFLLIDTAQYPGIWRILQYRFSRLTWVSLGENTEHPAHGPVLVHLHANQTKTLAWFLEHTEGMHCLSWIVSPLPLAELSAHMRSLATIQAEDGLEYAMRFYDTRILPVWYQTLDMAQEPHALGPITSWTFMDRDGMPCTLFGHGLSLAPEESTMHLTRTQEQALLDAALPDVVLQHLQENGNADLAALPPAQRYAFIADQVDKARKQYGITPLKEIVLFCSLALAIGQNFDRLLPVAQVLQKFSGKHAATNRFGALQSA